MTTQAVRRLASGARSILVRVAVRRHNLSDVGLAAKKEEPGIRDQTVCTEQSQRLQQRPIPKRGQVVRSRRGKQVTEAIYLGSRKLPRRQTGGLARPVELTTSGEELPLLGRREWAALFAKAPGRASVGRRMDRNPRRNVQYEEPDAILRVFVDDQGQGWGGSVEYSPLDYLRRIIERHPDKRRPSFSGFVSYPQHDAAAIGICEADSCLGQYRERLLH